MTDVGPSITLAQLTVNFAKQEVGQHEDPKGSNWGPRVKDYLAVVNVHSPASWCAGFAAFCIDSAAKALGVTLTMRFSASALHMLSLNPTLQIESCEPGCLVVWDHGKGLGHVGICATTDGAIASVISGNTNSDGSREGYEVCEQIKHLNDPRIAGYVRIA